MGFWKDTAEVKAILKKRMETGERRPSINEVLAEFQQHKSEEKPEPRRRYGRTFLISALLGAIWQSNRRR